MKISNRVRRNLSFTLMLLGIAIIIERGWELVMNPTSGNAWFQLCSIILLTYICFDNFRIYRKRVEQGILFGSK